MCGSVEADPRRDGIRPSLRSERVHHARSVPGRQPASRVLRYAAVLRMTAATDRAEALADQPEGWPLIYWLSATPARRAAVAEDPRQRPYGGTFPRLAGAVLERRKRLQTHGTSCSHCWLPNDQRGGGEPHASDPAGAHYGRHRRRQRPPRIDETHTVRASAYPNRGDAVTVDRVATQYQEDLPSVRPLVRHFDIEAGPLLAVRAACPVRPRADQSAQSLGRSGREAVLRATLALRDRRADGCPERPRSANRPAADRSPGSVASWKMSPELDDAKRFAAHLDTELAAELAVLCALGRYDQLTCRTTPSAPRHPPRHPQRAAAVAVGPGQPQSSAHRT